MPEINLTFYVPREYKVFVPKSNDTYLDKNNRPITNKKIIDELTKEDPKVILQIERQSNTSIFEMKIQWSAITEGNKKIIGDSVLNKKMAIALAKQSDKFDTTFTSVKIDTYKFNKIIITNYINEKELYSCSYRII